MACRVMKVIIRGQHHEIMMETQPSEEGVNCCKLHAFTPASVANLSRHNVIFSIWHDHWQRCKPLYYRVASFGAAETLQQLLKHEPRRINRLLRG